MTYDKDGVLNIIDKFKSNLDQATYGDIYKLLMDLSVDIKEDVFNIVVMGEFKRGKSTFVNALLGDAVLPTDVLPETTTINALRYSKKPRLKIVYRNGDIKIEAGDMGSLKDFSAQNKEFNPDDVNYVDIGYPSSYLAEGIMIIDTPGVSDINKQRCEITYGFVPKANAVLFLLDATSPLKRSEVEFIEDKLLNVGIDNIVFILNKYDLIDDEEDDEEDIIASTISRIRTNFTNENERLLLRNIKVLPLSAKDALTGQLNNNEIMYNESGMAALKRELIEIFDKEKIEEEKALGYKRRLESIIKAYIARLQQEKNLHMATIQELQEANRELTQLISEKGKCKTQLSDYVDTSVYKINQMTRKSLENFKENLVNDITYEIEQYKQADFKSFIEGRITRVITKSSEKWFYKNSTNINYLLKLIDEELSKGISRLFQQKIMLQTKNQQNLDNKSINFNMTAEDYTNDVNIKSGTLVGGGMVALSLLSGGLLIPVLSLAVFPTLRNHFLKKKVEEAKEMYLPAVLGGIDEIVDNMRRDAQHYVEDKAASIKANGELAYNSILEDYKTRIEGEIAAHEDSKADRKILINQIDANILALEKQLLCLN